MGVDLVDSAATCYNRTGVFSASTNDFTFMAWCRPDTLPVGVAPYDSIGGMRNAITSQLVHDGANVRWSIGTSASDFNGTSTVTAGVWCHVALTRSGNDKTLYLNGVQEASGNDAAAGNTELMIGSFNAGSADENWDGALAAVKIWDAAVLTLDEIKSEMHSFVPMRFANLRAFYPFWSTGDDETDFYTAGQTLTIFSGTPTTAEGPPIPYTRRRRRPVVYTATVIPPWEPEQDSNFKTWVNVSARW